MMTDAPENESLLSPAPTALLILAMLKALGVLFGVRLLFGSPAFPTHSPVTERLMEHATGAGIALSVVYGFQIVACLILRQGLRKFRPWARLLACVYAGFQILGLVTVPILGMIVLLNAALGAGILYGVARADRAGMFGSGPAGHPEGLA